MFMSEGITIDPTNNLRPTVAHQEPVMRGIEIRKGSGERGYSADGYLNQLSLTQQMVLDAVTSLGLNVDTASVFSTESDPTAPRQCAYDVPKA